MLHNILAVVFLFVCTPIVEKATKESYFLIYDNCESKVHKVYDIIIKVKYREKQPILLGAKKRDLLHIELIKQKSRYNKICSLSQIVICCVFAVFASVCLFLCPYFAVITRIIERTAERHERPNERHFALSLRKT